MATSQTTEMQVEGEISVEEVVKEMLEIEVEDDYYDTHGHDTPNHQLARGIIQEMFSGLPARDAETIGKARAELLAAELLKELCKQLGLAIPAELQMYQPPQRHWSTHRLPSLQDFH